MITDESAVEQTKKDRGSPYPSETISDALVIAKAISDAKGNDTITPREEIGVILGYSHGHLNMKLSTCVQYLLLTNVFGKGYRVSDKFDEYQRATEEEEERIKLEMFGAPLLYKSIITDYNNKQLPDEEKLLELFKNRYRIHPNSLDKALRPFMENVKSLKLIDSNRRFRYFVRKQSDSSVERKDNGSQEEGQQPPLPPLLPPTVDLQNASYSYVRNRTIPVVVPFANGEAVVFIPKEYENDELDLLSKIIAAYKKKDSANKVV